MRKVQLVVGIVLLAEALAYVGSRRSVGSVLRAAPFSELSTV